MYNQRGPQRQAPQQAPYTQKRAPAVQVATEIPRTSVLVDDVSYDLWKCGGGRYGANARGVGERYENGCWTQCHPALVCDGYKARLASQGVANTFGSYGLLWSSAMRHGTAFGVRITAADLRCLTQGNYLIGITPYSVFNPGVRPHSEQSDHTWLPFVVASSRGSVSLRGEIRKMQPWQGRVVEAGFHIRVGTQPGKIRVSIYINGRVVVHDENMKLPKQDSIHLFCFLNSFGDTAEMIPNWRPPPDPLGDPSQQPMSPHNNTMGYRGQQPRVMPSGGSKGGKGYNRAAPLY
eukprot:TRINITY_DN17119_c0_g1_i1.p1 TRINITY_DN17119_c0_g1~~TRINITY_DN17119_c0_g1_i1.p1  ORF type:complete len:292 (+),score=46.84 TRINITY_DN17119_c0_g1_i1:73-948(+)